MTTLSLEERQYQWDATSVLAGLKDKIAKRRSTLLEQASLADRFDQINPRSPFHVL